MPWKQGQSGNPGGLPQKGRAEVARLARLYTDEAISTLAEIMGNGDNQASARVAAATALLDRGWGKAPQEVIITEENGATDMQDDALTAAIAAEIAQLTAPLHRGKTQH